MSASGDNISTEHQPKGSARNLSDTLDRKTEPVPAGQRQRADDNAAVDARNTPDEHLQNAGARRGGEAAGGIEPQPADPTNPAAAHARARARDDEMAADHMGDDGARSTYRS